MQAKLRDAQEQKIPVMVVVGDRDAGGRRSLPALRTGESEQGVPLDAFVADLAARVPRPRAVAVRRGGDDAGDLAAPAMRKMRAIGQLALRSTDPQRARSSTRRPSASCAAPSTRRGVDLELGGFELSFRRAEHATRDGMQIGFRVDTAGEVDAWAQELAQRGFALVAPPSGDRWEGTRSFRVADPDGRQVAIFYDYPR